MGVQYHTEDEVTRHKTFRFYFFAGVAIGIVIAWGVTNTLLRDLVFSNSIATTIFTVIHYPAELLADAWSMAGLPPHGDAAMVYLPTIGIVLQWTILGSIAGVISVILDQRKIGGDQAQQ